MTRIGLRDRGGKNLNDGNTTITLRLRLVVGIVVRSLGSGGGIPLLGVKMRCSQRLEDKTYINE